MPRRPRSTRTWTHLLALATALSLAGAAHAEPEDDDAEDADAEGAEAIAELPLELDQLIEVAVRLSPDLVRARIERTAARDAAAAERSAQAWTMTSNGTYTRNSIAARVEAPPFSVVAEDRQAFALGLGRLLPTGGQLAFELGVEHVHTEYAIPNTLRDTAAAAAETGAEIPTEHGYRTQSSARATFKQPLARGFGPAIALANERKGDLAATTATVKAQLAGEDLLRDLITGYWELAYASFELDVRIQALELARKQDKLTHQQMRAGTVPSSALDAVTYEIAVRDEARLRAVTQLEQRSLELRRLAGLELSRRQIVLRPAAAMELGDDEELDVDAVLRRSRSGNRRLAALTLEQKLADVDVRLARDRAKPQVDLELSGAMIGIGDATGDALAGLGGGEAYEVRVGLSVSWELSGAARRGLDAARAKRRRVDVDRADLARQIETELVLAVKSVRSARARVELADRAIAVAENNVRAERASFLVGRTTNFQVMQRQSELIEARLRRGRAVADYHVAVAQVQYLGGTLLERHGVRARPRRR